MDGISTVLLAGNHLDDGAFREGTTATSNSRQADAPLTCECIFSPEPASPAESANCAFRQRGAVANAYARATGDKPRNFPIDF